MLRCARCVRTISAVAVYVCAGDRATIFIEIIQRVGCMKTPSAPAAAAVAAAEAVAQATSSAPAAAVAVKEPANEPQTAGCGGFGKGNFSELFKRIEDYERTLNV